MFTSKRFFELTEQSRAIVLSPRGSRAQFLTAIMTSGQPIWYYSVTSETQTLPQFLDDFIVHSANLPGFGGETARLLRRSQSGSKLIEAFAADLSASGVRYLIIDSLDQVIDNEDIAAFLAQLISALPESTKLVLNSRYLPYDKWAAEIESGALVIVEDTSYSDAYTFKPILPYLEVYGFGRGHVIINGCSVETWDGPLPKNLFFFLIDNPLVTRDEIFETFWPGVPTKDATNVFHVTKRKIAERLGYELTEYRSGFYRPSDHLTIFYDVANFQSYYRSSESASDPLEQLKPALWLYRSEFLHNWSMPWVVARRDELKAQYVEGLVRAGTAYKARNDREHALNSYLIAAREMPHREDVQREIMSLYEDLGQHEKALRQYQRLADHLRVNFNIAPSRESRELFQMLRERPKR